MNDIGKWLAFCDEEIGIFQEYFREYIITFPELFEDPMLAYNLGVLGCETQYQMRLLKARILGEKNEQEVQSNNRYIKLLNSYPNLITFVCNRFTTDFNEREDIFKTKYLTQIPHSFFNKSGKIKKELCQEILKIEIN